MSLNEAAGPLVRNLGLSGFARRLALEDQLFDLGVTQRRKTKTKKDDGKKTRMNELTILDEDVRYVDLDRRTYQPSRGERVSVKSDRVARTLLNSGQAARGWTAVDSVEVASEEPGGSSREESSPPRKGGGSDEGGPAASWDDVDGLSGPAYDLLSSRAPDVDPRSLDPTSDEDRTKLLAWLDDSEGRARLAWVAIENFQAEEDSSEEEEGSEEEEAGDEP